jgi:DNA polymerase-3 subunit chi
MTSIDFYILGATKQLDRLDFVCRLVEKVYGEGRKVYLHTENEKQAIWLDEHLWKFKADAFIPHNIIGNAEQPEAQIHHADVLVNLSRPIPTFFSRFDRVLEVVIQDEAVLEETRKHYKFYKERGYEVTHRDLRG